MGKFKRISRGLPDPRAANSLHELAEILFIALAAVLCGAKAHVRSSCQLAWSSQSTPLRLKCDSCDNGAHVRRKLYEIHAAGNVPIATEALQRIAGLYALEAEIRGQPATERLRRRQQNSQPIIDALKPWLEARLAEVSRKAIRYALSRWAGLVRFLDDGHLEIDNNAVERAMRPIALGRKNHLFAGSDGGARH